MDLDTAPAQLLRQRDAQIVVKPVEQFLAPDDFDDVAAETAEDTGELDRSSASFDEMTCSMPGMFGTVGWPPVATRIFSAV